jgi:uncharacterized cupin superfamily protein
MRTPPRHLLRRADIEALPGLHVRHPFNPRSDVTMRSLGDPTGISSYGINLARIPAGKESFVPHAHTVNHEWVYVLEGQGHARIGDEEHAVGVGDFLGFPPDGTVHHLRNTGEGDLVVLQGGERRPFEVGLFPTLGKRMVFDQARGVVDVIAEQDVQQLSLSAWVAKDGPGEG